jgi:hypothetical protein
MKRTTKQFRMAPLQTLTVKPIKDPVEQAALDERLRQSKAAVSESGDGNGVRGKVTVPLILELCRQLSAQARRKVMEQLATQLPAEVLRQLAEQFREQAGS